MKNNHDEKTASAHEIILHESQEPMAVNNITIKVYLYGEEAAADTYKFKA